MTNFTEETWRTWSFTPEKKPRTDQSSNCATDLLGQGVLTRATNRNMAERFLREYGWLKISCIINSLTAPQAAAYESCKPGALRTACRLQSKNLSPNNFSFLLWNQGWTLERIFQVAVLRVLTGSLQCFPFSSWICNILVQKSLPYNFYVDPFPILTNFCSFQIDRAEFIMILCMWS